MLINEEPLKSLKLLMIGGGVMGGTIAAGLARSSKEPPTVLVVDPAFDLPDGLLNIGTELLTARNATAVPEPDKWQPDYVLVAVKPQMIAQALPTYVSWIKNAKALISIAAGTGIQRLHDIAGAETPVVRCMPNTPVAAGRGVLACFASEAVTVETRLELEALLSVLGDVLWLSRERDIDAATAISGSGPAYVFHFIEALTAAAQELGFSGDIASRLACATVCGAAALVESSDASVTALRERVTSKGGTTEAALEVLMHGDALTMLMQDATNAAFKRGKALNQDG